MPTLNDLHLAGKRVLVRVDFNVPLSTNDAGEQIVADDTRIRAALPTISHILQAGGMAILVSHLGRPKGIFDEAYSMRPVGQHLALLTGSPVIMAPAVVGADVLEIAKSVAPGEILLLENVRFEPGETKNEPALAAALAELADVTLEALVNREADPLGIVPTSSALVALAMGDALAGAVMHAKGVDESDFARYHPAGQLGRRLLLSIGDVMHPLEKCAVVEPNVSIRELVIEMTQNPLGAALVMKDRRELLGIITDGDLRRALAKEENVMDLTSEQLMTANPTCIASTASLHDAVKTMEERESQISVLPVNDVQSQTAIGLVRLHDVYQPA